MHSITALIVNSAYDDRAATEWDVSAVALDGGLWLFHLSHYWTAYQQARRGTTGTLDVPSRFPPVFPREAVVTDLAGALTGAEQPTFALVMTDYFGGAGDQWACAYQAGRPVPGADDINSALRVLGVRAAAGRDEFDTVGLGAHRSPPGYLDRYEDLCDELGV
ncbi:hypothetical protein AB0F81_09350 [Actinoplanes sp. NPDC024001]|uniref:hypothetical protein n=1 Tax=Actinoplanes sp. NPDC024001 TaxID=3154598 RepID=UPI0033D26674